MKMTQKEMIRVLSSQDITVIITTAERPVAENAYNFKQNVINSEMKLRGNSLHNSIEKKKILRKNFVKRDERQKT